MTTTHFTTGREYRTDGTPQRIEINYPQHQTSIWDDDAWQDISVTFNDPARGIRGNVKVAKFECNPEEINSAVLGRYDANNYELA